MIFLDLICDTTIKHPGWQPGRKLDREHPDLYIFIYNTVIFPACVCVVGELTLVIDDAVYGLDLTHQDKKSREDLSGNEYLLCALSMDKSLCVNISSFTQHGCRSLHTRLSHPFPWQPSAGMLRNILSHL